MVLGIVACDSTGRHDTAIPQPRPQSQSQPPQPPPAQPQAPPPPSPACAETQNDVGPWPRPQSLVRVVPANPGSLGRLEQSWNDKPFRLRFLGAHLFDLLDKIVHEGGSSERERRQVICAALEAVAKNGAPVVRIWGTLKTTGAMDEVERAAEALALLLDENARRTRPLRFVVTLQNHQAGYGAPDSTRSLDDQDPKSPFFTRRFYLEGGWKENGAGSLADRIEALARRPEIENDKNVLAFELVNELDTFRHVGHGSFEGPDAQRLARDFAVPALEMLAERLPQPILLGDVRGHEKPYRSFQAALVTALRPETRSRLVWTTHVYTTLEKTGQSAADERATWKLDQDLALARAFGLPLLVGELGQHVPSGKNEARHFCRGGPPHDLAGLFGAALDGTERHPERGEIDAALLWGEGLCDLELPGGRHISIGAGGDSADIGPDEGPSRKLVKEKRATSRFRAE